MRIRKSKKGVEMSFLVKMIIALFFLLILSLIIPSTTNAWDKFSGILTFWKTDQPKPVKPQEFPDYFDAFNKAIRDSDKVIAYEFSGDEIKEIFNENNMLCMQKIKIDSLSNVFLIKTELAKKPVYLIFSERYPRNIGVLIANPDLFKDDKKLFSYNEARSLMTGNSGLSDPLNPMIFIKTPWYKTNIRIDQDYCISDNPKYCLETNVVQAVNIALQTCPK